LTKIGGDFTLQNRDLGHPSLKTGYLSMLKWGKRSRRSKLNGIRKFGKMENNYQIVILTIHSKKMSGLEQKSSRSAHHIHWLLLPSKNGKLLTSSNIEIY